MGVSAGARSVLSRGDRRAPAQIFIKQLGSHEALDVVDALELRAFEILESKIGLAAGVVEFLGAAADVPLRFEGGHFALDLAEVDAIAALVGAAGGGVF